MHLKLAIGENIIEGQQNQLLIGYQQPIL